MPGSQEGAGAPAADPSGDAGPSTHPRHQGPQSIPASRQLQGQCSTSWTRRQGRLWVLSIRVSALRGRLEISQKGDIVLADKCQNRYKRSLRQLGEAKKASDPGSSKYQGAGWSAAAFGPRGTVPLPAGTQPAAERGPGACCDPTAVPVGELGARPLLLLGTYLST